jgi:hypothetical protein
MVYDLAEGSVLVVQCTRGETTLRQLRRALSDTSGFPGRSPLCRREPVLCDLPRGIAYREARLRLVVSGELQDALREHAQAISPAPFAMT